MEAVQKSTMVWSSGLSTICRLCMQNDGFLLAIFNNHSSIGTSEHRSIQRKIAECTTLELSSGDGLPPCVCHRCLYKVELCLEFRQQCLESDTILRQHRPRECNGEGVSDQDSEEFRNYDIPPDQSIEDVVMVVDPTMDYDSENESDFEQHVSDTDNGPENFKNVFMCKYCDKAYTVKEECRVHETTSHNFEVPFQCSTCAMDFGDRTVYTAHLKSVHSNDKPFQCPDCERSFSRRSDLRKHTVVHTGIKPFTCHICFKSFSRNTNLTKHLRIHTGSKPYVCPQCPKTFISKGDLTRHAIIHSGQKPFACSYCDQSFGRRDKLLRHEKRHLPVSQQVEPLENEGGHWLDTENNRENLTAKTEEDFEKPDERNEGDEDDDRDSWNGQNMVVSVDPFQGQPFGEEKGQSPLISEENRTLPPVPEHITADSDYTPIKRYPCLVCHQRFSTAEDHRTHMLTHNSAVDVFKPHICPLCNKSFLRKRELDRHIAIHTGMKPFKCTSCDKRFGRKDKLVRHMRIHEPGRQVLHNCPICGISFARKDSLTQHMKNHNSTEELV